MDVLTASTGVTSTLIEEGRAATGELDVLLETAFELEEAALDADEDATLESVELLGVGFELVELAIVLLLVLAGTAVELATLTASTLVLGMIPVLAIGHITAGV